MPKTTITAATVTKARADARPSGARYDVVDAKATGLSLRVSPRGVQWSWRYQLNGADKRLALGDVDMWTIAEARDLVGRAQAMLRDRTGIPDTDWLDRQRRIAGKAEPLPLAVARPKDIFAWTFAQGRAAYLDEIDRTRRPATLADYKSMLTLPDLASLEKKPLPSISRTDLAGVISKIHRSGRESTAEHMVRVMRPFWKWLAGDGQTSKSGIVPGAMDGLAAPERTLDETDDAGEYVPPLEELGRIIAICRSGSIDPVVAAAVELTMWTAQRRRAVAEATLDQFEDVGGGQGLWHVPPASRKTRSKAGTKKRPHVIPLPTPVWPAWPRPSQPPRRRNRHTCSPSCGRRRPATTRPVSIRAASPMPSASCLAFRRRRTTYGGHSARTAKAGSVCCGRMCKRSSIMLRDPATSRGRTTVCTTARIVPGRS